MNTPVTYIPSVLLPGDAGLLREHSFTNWMSRDLLQASTDFCKNLGLVPLYAECSKEGLARYIFWRFPPGAKIEVRSGRTKEKFEDHDRANRERNWLLLSLHVSENDIYSAVWISAEHYDIGKRVLVSHGIIPAEKKFA